VNAGVDELDVAISGNHMMDTTNVPARMSILINFMYRVNECIAFPSRLPASNIPQTMLSAGRSFVCSTFP
jgi:hypothetical protein